jgi:molybdopterin-guanine dinucleotide biosynthesis protein A
MQTAAAPLFLPFSAVILAGGRSTRMGRDKARLELHGRPLLARQIALARSLAPVEVLISGRAETDYSDFGCPVLLDRMPDAGPLAGIAVALEVARAPLVLVLAVDLPHLTPGVLERVLAAAGENRGVVPRVAGRVEPLAALYPRSAALLADEQLARQRFAVRDFAQVCAAAHLVRFLDLPVECAGAFANWNTPEDLATST